MISRFRKSKWTNTVLALVLITSVGFIGLTACKPASQTEILSNPSVNTEDKDVAEEGPGNEEINSKSNANTVAKSENSTKTDYKTQDNATAEKSTKSITTKTSENEEVFYGNWVIKRVLAYGSVETYSKEVAESLIGKSLIFSKDKANFFGDEASYINQIATNPIYKKSTLSNETFIENYRMTLDKLGVKTESITEVTVSHSKDLVSTFLIKDKNTLILIGGGTYFELVRK